MDGILSVNVLSSIILSDCIKDAHILKLTLILSHCSLAVDIKLLVTILDRDSILELSLNNVFSKATCNDEEEEE